MICRSITLSEEPFAFDIQWPFPPDERNALVHAIQSIPITSPSEVNRLEEQLNTHLERRGYLWDRHHKDACNLWRPDFRKCVDFYNSAQKIAVEVEKTEVKKVVHDFLKLVNGSMTFVPKVRYGVIIHPETYLRTTGKEGPFASTVASEIPFYFKRLMLNTRLNDLLFIIYDLRSGPNHGHEGTSDPGRQTD